MAGQDLCGLMQDIADLGMEEDSGDMAPPGLGWIWLPETFVVSELPETALLQHFDVTRAKQLLQGSSSPGATCGLQPKASLIGWRAMAATLGGLAYQPEAADLWHWLGLVPLWHPDLGGRD